MDPQTQPFTPYSSNNETWRLQTEVVRIQQVQADHSERIAGLERRLEDDARMKSVWGSNSPFPSVLSGGTPQQGSYSDKECEVVADSLQHHSSSRLALTTFATLMTTRTI